ncbi:MAG: hypothetical protein PHE24_00150 [Patescibacteria group bacterium]|nr:hypothetical protein [Patescibacteria group bacterium]
MLAQRSVRFASLSGLVLMVVSLLSCSVNKEVSSPVIFKVKHLPAGKCIAANDSLLKDWDASYLVFAVDSANAKISQWKNVRGRLPASLKRNQIEIKVYMAYDDSFWYVAADIKDDDIVASSYGSPYDGDCLELFFAGDNFDARMDFHSLLSHPYHSFFQLEIPAKATGKWVDHLPGYRNDGLISSGDIAVATWTANRSWKCQTRISLAAFKRADSLKLERGDVRKLLIAKINNHQPMKFNLDYLNYNKKPATYNDDYGFHPNNVFSPSRKESGVNVPREMGSIIFE